jgi:hypothetical protein
MKAADKTIEFCKAWIAGGLTKSQHMHYYIVKTPHAEFMMKRNEQPDLVAIKDSFGHVFIPDDSMSRHSFNDERVSRNPFFALIQVSKHAFAYSILTEEPLRELTDLSKWQTLSHLAVPHKSGLHIKLALIKIGETRYTTEVPQNSANTTMPLLDWANYKDIRTADLRGYVAEQQVQPYSVLTEAQGKPNRLEACRTAYVDFAGDMKAHSTISGKWITIPTDKVNLSDVLHKGINEIIKTRPMPYLYNVPPTLIDAGLAMARLDYPFHPEKITSQTSFIRQENLPNNRDFLRSGESWAGWLVNNLEYELANNLIRFINDDDAWLRENAHTIAPIVHGDRFRQALFGQGLNGYPLLVEESNPSVLPTHVLYAKGTTLTTEYSRTKPVTTYRAFTKFIPAPHTEDKTHLERFMNNVCE